jgi:hypothetical protein
MYCTVVEAERAYSIVVLYVPEQCTGKTSCEYTAIWLDIKDRHFYRIRIPITDRSVRCLEERAYTGTYIAG